MTFNLKIFRLIDSEIIIGIVEESSSDETSSPALEEFEDYCFLLHFPFKLIATKLSNDGWYVALENWIPFSRDPFVSVLKDKIVAISDPSTDVAALYKELQESLCQQFVENENVPETQKEFLQKIVFDKDDVH